MIKSREVARTPEVPPMTPEMIQLLNTLCFRKDDAHLPKVDCIFIFGSAVSYNEIGGTLNSLLVDNLSQEIIISGGIVNYQESETHSLSEAEMIYDAVMHYIPKSTNVILEKKSQNTLENVVFGLGMLDKKPNSMCFIGKSFHVGRAYLTLKKYLPEAILYQRSVNPLFPSASEHLNVNNWHCYPEFSGRVWGEFLRIKKYGERGDIDYNNVAKCLIDQIDNICASFNASNQNPT